MCTSIQDCYELAMTGRIDATFVAAARNVAMYCCTQLKEFLEPWTPKCSAPIEKIRATFEFLTTRFSKLITSINFTQHTQDFASPSGHVLHASSWSNRPAKYPLFFCESQAFASVDRCWGPNPFILLSYLFLFGSSSRVPLYLCGAMLQMPLVG